jgi:hypothetical protein
MNGAKSELVVPSDHSAHQNPKAIREVRRILMLNGEHRETRQSSSKIRKLNWAHLDSKWMAAAFSVLCMFWLLSGRSLCQDRCK